MIQINCLLVNELNFKKNYWIPTNIFLTKAPNEKWIPMRERDRERDDVDVNDWQNKNKNFVG